MFISKFVVFISSLLILVFGAVASTLAQGPPPKAAGPNFVVGEILVKFKPGGGVQDNQKRLATVQGTIVQSIPAIGTLRVKVPPGREQAIIARLQARPDVEYAEPNYIIRAAGIPDDPFYGSQWGLPKIELPAAWDIAAGSSSIIVAIVDTGIDLDHPDFSCTVSGGVDKLADGADLYNNNSNPDDDHGHGSHVAGSVGACTNNGTGVAGTAPNTRLMPVKVLNSSGGGTYAGVASGVTYAVDHGAKIINLSLGGEANDNTLASAIQYAYDQGVLVVAAAGNLAQKGNPPFYPGAYPGAMAVAATDANDNWASFSGHRPYVEVAAPGVSIYSTWTWGGYRTESGTSMSVPHVAGLAALIWSVNPGLTHDEVRQIIQFTADDLGIAGKDEFFGFGRINALRALELLTAVNLQDTSGQEITTPLLFLVDDHPEYLPAERTVQLSTVHPQVITWTASISPGVSWLSVSPPASGLVSASTTAQVTLVATRPVTYTNPYSQATLIITGTTSTDLKVGPTTNEVRIKYMPELWRWRFPIIFKN